MAQAAVVEQQTTDKTALITGSEAIAVACQLADVDVITAYPIRPYDTVMQYICKLVANGVMDCEYIVAEGEHSQFEIVKHASACGARGNLSSTINGHTGREVGNNYYPGTIPSKACRSMSWRSSFTFCRRRNPMSGHS